MIDNQMPQLKELNGHPALYVNGNPFIILGLQWDCDWCYHPHELDAYFEEIKKMNANTASLLLYWREVEPVKDVYDFSFLDHRIEMARKYDMKIVLVWFASFKNACLTYAPDYIRGDHKTYRKVHRKQGGLISNCCCPTAEETHERDRLALIKLFSHLKEMDGEEHTVILFQMENETGILESNRCYCEECNKQYVSGGWEKRYGWRGPEAFTAGSIAEYCDSLTKTVKEIYPLVVYMNAALPHEHVNSVAGNHWTASRNGHFCGGPIGNVLEVYKEKLHFIDFISPDIYQPSYRDFHKFCSEYLWEGNPLFVAECATGAGMRTDRNAIYSIGEYAAIGYDPWSVTRNCPDFMSKPLINPAGMQWSDEAFELLRSYKIIADIMVPLAKAQGSNDLMSFVQEDAENGVKHAFGDVWVELRYADPKKAARGFVIRQSDDEYVVSALGVYVQFSRIWGEALPVASVEVGGFDGDKWQCRYRMSSENEDETSPISIRDCMTLRIKLGKRIDHLTQ